MLTPTPTPAPPVALTVEQRVRAATALVRAYASKLSLACIKKQRAGVCPPADQENLRWLLLVLEALAHPLPSTPVPLIFRCGCQQVFDWHGRLALLLEVARRYPLLAGALNPFCLFQAPPENTPVLLIINVQGSDALTITVRGTEPVPPEILATF